MAMPSQPASAIARWNSCGKPPSSSFCSQYSSPNRPHSRDTAARISCCSWVNVKLISDSVRPAASGARSMLNSPAGALSKHVIEFKAICLFGRSADSVIQKLGVLSDENAPSLRLHAVEDDGRCFRSTRGRVLAETFFHFRHPRPDLIVGMADDVDILRSEPFARGGYVDRRLAALQNSPRIRRDVGANVAGHDDRTLDVRRIEREVGHQSFGKALYREFGGAIGGMRTDRPERSPEAVHAAGVDDMAFVRLPQQRQEGACAVIDTVPADAEGLVPVCAIAVDEASAAANPGIVEQQMDMIRVEIARYGVGKCQHLILDRHIGHECRYPHPLPRLGQAKPLGFGHPFGKHIADGNVAAHGHELKRQLAPHARAATGDDGNLPFETLHADFLSGRKTRRLGSAICFCREWRAQAARLIS